MSLDHLDRLAAAAGFATAFADDDGIDRTPTARIEAEFVPLTRSHWPDAPAPRGRSSPVTALVPIAPMWTAQPDSVSTAWLASAASATRALRNVVALVTSRATGRGIPA